MGDTVVSVAAPIVAATPRGLTRGAVRRVDRFASAPWAGANGPDECSAPTLGQHELHRPVLDWYDDHARDLPWRGPGATPWAVMVSEFMLQQTPVVRVLPVFESWMSTWPTPGALAGVPSGEAVRAWGRLGYPRRALRLHAAATAIVERHDGQVPTPATT